MDNDEARQLLHDERDRLTQLLADETEAVDEQRDTDPAASDMAKDLTDRQVEESELEQVRAQLAEVDAALQRIEDGTYGVSEVSGEPIPDERLRAVPYARRLVDEQQVVDNQARATAVERQ